MARTEAVGLPDGERIEDVDVSEEMQGSFLEYAYSVIYSRALPDARDGLKPVQRRILYQMAEMGLRPDRGHVKSARVTGEVMGKLHPHGDGAIYDALVRMAQPFTMRVPLVDGHGNFGSLDDGPAAARYTEARLAEPSMAMTEGLGEDVVDFVPNYDNQIMQPGVLPAAFPNLLVNGASGIAVGMATNMAPHNLGEVVEAAKHLLLNPTATLEELMEFVPGPDLPSGGTIVGLSGVATPTRPGAGRSAPGEGERREPHATQGRPRRHGAAVPGRPRTRDREDQGRGAGEEARRHLRRQRPDRPEPRAAARHRHQVGLQPDGSARAAVQAHPARGRLRHQQRRARDTGHRARSACANCSTSTCSTGSTWSRDAPSTGSPVGRNAAPRRGSARRDPRHRRGHRGHPLVRRLRGRPHTTAGRLRPVRGAGRVHPRAATAAPDEVLAPRARGRARPAARRHSPRSRNCSPPTPDSVPRWRRSSPRCPTRFATPRRTLLNRGRCPGGWWPQGRGRPRVAAGRRRSVPRAALTTTGRLVRWTSPTPTRSVRVPKRSRSTTRSARPSCRPSAGQVGALTSTGRVLRFSPVDVPRRAAGGPSGSTRCPGVRLPRASPGPRRSSRSSTCRGCDGLARGSHRAGMS